MKYSHICSNPNLPVLSPDELTEGITNRSSVHVSEMDDALWETIQKARDRGALVLVMGAGSIDGWLREMMAIEHSAQILVMDIEGNFVLQLHDDNPDTFNPGKLGPFGGRIEMTTDTSFIAAAVKKLQEQTNLEVTANDLAYFKILPNTENGRKINVAYYVLTGITPGTLEVKQGQGYMKVSPNDLKRYPLTIATRSIIAEYTHPAL